MRKRTWMALGLLLASATVLHARVTRVEVTERIVTEATATTPTVERIRAKVYFSLRPEDKANRGIVDLDKAPRDAKGEVEFQADLLVVRPIQGGNGSMLLEIPNRGGTGLLGLIDGGAGVPENSGQMGDAWLLRQGFTYASLGWQWDVQRGPGKLALEAPVAMGTPPHAHITGLLRDDYTPWRVEEEIPLGHVILDRIGGTEYAAAAPEDARNVLTVRDSYHGMRRVIPRAEWSFAHTTNGKLVASDRYVHLNGGFQPGRIYELVYVVQDPVVAGLGFAAVRDFASWSKHDAKSLTSAHRVYAAGISQCGRFLRDFVYEGFNADEEGKIALDGVLAHVAGAGRGSFNVRFAQPSRDAEPSSSIDWPTDIFPYTDRPESDPLTPDAAARGLLDKARQEGVVPKIFFSNTSHEYWSRAESLTHTTADGQKDFAPGKNVRIYFYAGLQHFSGPFPPRKGVGPLASQQWMSPLPIHWFWRAMVANMDAWVRGEKQPPPSRYPTLASGTLIRRAELRFPTIPDLNPPATMAEGWKLDFGPHAAQGVLERQPPRIMGEYPARVPQVDADGNDLGGVRLPEMDVPLATYTGWNLRAAAIGAPMDRLPFLGSFVPLARTTAEAEARHDSRRPILSRYASREAYVAAYTRALDGLIGAGYVLAVDRSAMQKQAGVEWEWAMQQPGD